MTLGTDDKPLIITDGVVNVMPKLEVKMHILRNAIDFANKIGISRPKVSILSATTPVLLLPLQSLVTKKMPVPFAWFGAILTVIGTSLLI